MAVSNTQILNEIKDISVSIARIDGRLTPIESASAQLMKVVIQGNGKLPLTQRVQTLEDCRDTETKKKEKWDGRTWAIIMLVIGQIITMAFLLMKATLTI
jgi:hypothetical protein